MFLTYLDFDGFGSINFDAETIKKYKSFDLRLKKLLKTNDSISLKSSNERNVIEDKYFWRDTGNLISQQTNLDKIK